jgi:signal transduction histidine kinase
MRLRLLFLVATTTSAIVLAFLIPLALLLRTLAEDRALDAARIEAQSLGTIAVKITDPDQLHRLLASQVGEHDGAETTVILPDGTEIGPAVPSDDPYLVAAQEGSSIIRPQGEDRVLYLPVIGQNGTVVVRSVVPEEHLRHGVVGATATVALLALLLLSIAVFAADRMARRLSTPIHQVADAADALRAGRLQTRVPERGPPEIVAMAGALNRLAGRIEELLAAERDAVTDLSHRLRTPVTALRLDADSIADPDLADRLQDHVTQLERTVDAIVRDARRPTHEGVVPWCDANKVVTDRVAFWSALADDQQRSLHLTVPARPQHVRLQESDLADAVDVLLDNAFAHTDENVPIEVWMVQRADRTVILSVEDGGPGLPTGDIAARGRSGRGSSGLGLDIARRAALASGGRLELGRSRLGGALVRLYLGPADR